MNHLLTRITLLLVLTCPFTRESWGKGLPLQPQASHTKSDSVAQIRFTDFNYSFSMKQPENMDQDHPKDNSGRKIDLNEVPVNKQYHWIMVIFEGNNVRFRIIVDKINRAKDKAEIDEILQPWVFPNPNVDEDTEIVKEFVELMYSRFAED